MTDYFAHDDALEPALAVVCGVLRINPNIGSQLRQSKTSFLSLAQCYQKQRSPEDEYLELAKKQSPGQADLPRITSHLDALEVTPPHTN